MIKSNVFLTGMVIFLLVIGTFSPVMAAEERMSAQNFENNDDQKVVEEQFSRFSHEGYDEKHRCPAPVPPSFTAVENLTIDSSLMNATPHWIFLAAGKTEQKALLSYIRHANISARKKAQWSMFMMKSWMKYPVKFIKTENGAMLVPGRMQHNFSLTQQENRTFQEIEKYIAEDMSNIEDKTVGVRWYTEPTHRVFMETALQNQANIPSELKSLAANAVSAPDGWYSFPVLQMNHGFVPLGILPNVLPFPPQIVGIGLAPDNFGTFATTAKLLFMTHNYEAAFTNMGYASHFITDLGNPFHTPNAQFVALEYIDSPWSNIIFPNSQMIVNYEKLHNKYEEMVAQNWGKYYDGNSATYPIVDPTYSAKVHGAYSWAMNYPLVYNYYWHFVMTGNLDLSNDPIVTGITRSRVSETMKHVRGLVDFVTGGQAPTLTITATAGEHGSISPPGSVPAMYKSTPTFTITPESGYIIDDVKVDGVSKGAEASHKFEPVTADHTIHATFRQNLPAIVPLCPAGTPFDASKYPQNTPQSDPMTSTCYWDGNGRVYLSGSSSELIGAWADDGFTVDTPKGIQFDAEGHYAHQHPPLEITAGMNKGSNTLTVIVRNWMGLSMWYGQFAPGSISQTPYFIEVNTPEAPLAAAKTSGAEELPPFITRTDNGLMINGTLVTA